MCVVISECATSVVCVCGIDRRARVCVLLFATPNTLVLCLDTPRERDWTDVRAVTFRRMIYSNYWYQKRLKSSLNTGHDGHGARGVGGGPRVAVGLGAVRFPATLRPSLVGLRLAVAFSLGG